jgi:hypothetical protein
MEIPVSRSGGRGTVACLAVNVPARARARLERRGHEDGMKKREERSSITGGGRWSRALFRPVVQALVMDD